ncbi:hypothetical protein [Pseudomonas sp. UMAB-40]|uniref:hypothetical protein n=1 Tax=Pseudomonas sp. UMAB-40 TaxID=1365407 RepID=UPI001C59258D|nr:hypothetical protein [Pseudomonas sp. UMAB-40]
MIVPKVAGYFPLLPDASIILDSCQNDGNDERKKYGTAINVFNCYLDITDQRCLELPDDKLNLLLQRYYGFLVVETSAIDQNRYTLFNRVERLLKTRFNRVLSTDVSTLCETQYMQEGVRQYRGLRKSVRKLKAYHGDFVSVRNGKPIFINLINFRQKFPEITDDVFESISVYLGRFPRNSAITELSRVNRVLELFCRTLKGDQDFRLLKNSEHVSRFFEHYHVLERKQVEHEGGNVKVFSVTWNCCMRIVEQIFIHDGIIAQSSSPLPRSFYKARADEPRADGHPDKLFAGLTEISIAIKDEEAAELVLDRIETDIDWVVRWSEQARALTMQRLKRRRFLARSYKSGQPIVSEDVERRFPELAGVADYNLFSSRCAAWDENAFMLTEGQLKVLFGNQRRWWVEELGLLTTTTLMPFLLLLVHEHPAITPSWFEGFTLYNKHGIRSGIRRVKKLWVAVGKKPRKGSGRAIQAITLNKRSRKLFVEILMLTREARLHLKAADNQDYRYLLIGGQSGFKKPKRHTLSKPSTTRYDNSSITTTIMNSVESANDSEHLIELFERLSLRELRTSRAIQIFLKTRSLRKASQALGHEEFTQSQMDRYVPKRFSEFMVDRWVRIFIEGMIFEAMKDSDYLHEAVSFTDVADIDRFLTNHQWKPLPSVIIKGYGVGYSDAIKTLSSEKIYLPFSAEVCTVLLSIGVALDSVVRAHQPVPKHLKLWHGTANFIAAVKNEANEHPELPITPAALAVIRNSEADPDLIHRLKKELPYA